jgi:hypothetical protein
MCVIVICQPGFTPPKDMIYNAVYNNWNGYGLILKDQKAEKIQVLQKCPEENDPEEIYDLLKDNEDIERILHVRHTTVGDTSFANTQPFCVYNSDTRQSYFMHNGTMGMGYDTRPLNEFQEEYLDMDGIDQNSSDSKRWARFKLQPFLTRVKGGMGAADTTDPFVVEWLNRIWPNGGSRGLIIHNNLPHFFFGRWEVVSVQSIVGGKEVPIKFYASNDDYFKHVIRGPEFDRRQEARRKANPPLLESPRGQRGNFTEAPAGVTNLHCPTFTMRYGISSEIKHIMEDHDVYEPEGYISLANMTFSEMEEFIKETSDQSKAGFIFYLTDHLRTMYVEMHKEIGKRTGLQKEIKSLEKELKNLRKEFKEQPTRIYPEEGEVNVG